MWISLNFGDASAFFALTMTNSVTFSSEILDEILSVFDFAKIDKAWCSRFTATNEFLILVDPEL